MRYCGYCVRDIDKFRVSEGIIDNRARLARWKLHWRPHRLASRRGNCASREGPGDSSCIFGARLAHEKACTERATKRFSSECFQLVLPCESIAKMRYKSRREKKKHNSLCKINSTKMPLTCGFSSSGKVIVEESLGIYYLYCIQVCHEVEGIARIIVHWW